MEFPKEYYRSKEILHIGCEKPRAYYIPYESEEKAKCDLSLTENGRENSCFFRNLSGEWAFGFFPAVDGIRDIGEAFDTLPDTIPVPSCWQLQWGRSYDLPQYTNINYPFPCDPPFLPDDVPCGLYERHFFLSASELRDSAVYAVFEGVCSSFYLWINRRLIGYSEVSHCVSEFDITAALREGENVISVLVPKWCSGSYLEDQDMFRLSGIFREVYLLLREKRHLADVYIRPTLDDTLTGGSLSVSCTFTGEELPVFFRLYTPEGSLLAEGKYEGSISLQTPALWSDESPALYMLILHCGREYLKFDVGFRRIEVRNRTVLLNGQKWKARGVNRHDTHPDHGYTTPLAHIVNDLCIMKANNINFVRTAHYPNDPRFPLLCARIGIGICAEADLETHGVAFTALGWDGLADDPSWQTHFLDRAERLIERDKNCPAVLLWSLGNESGDGCNRTAMAERIRSRDPSRLIHSEDATQRSFNVPRSDGLSYSPITDLDSRMYYSPAMCRADYLEKDLPHPFFLCEYAHAMGNGPGGLAEYRRLFYENDAVLGGCVWEFCDHALRVTRPDGKKYLAYGGDFGEAPHDGHFCADGLISPDRESGGGMEELRNAYLPLAFSLTDIMTHSFRVSSLLSFIPVQSLYEIHWRQEINGIKKKSGILTFPLPPRKEVVFSLPLPSPNGLGEETVRFTLIYKKDTPWAKKGSSAGFFQCVLTENFTPPPLFSEPAPLTSERNGDLFTFRRGNAFYAIDLRRGRLSGMGRNGVSLLRSPLTFDLWYAPTDNDVLREPAWREHGYDRIGSRLVSSFVDEKKRELTFSLALAPDTVFRSRRSPAAVPSDTSPILYLNVGYRITEQGGLLVSCCGRKARKTLPAFPRLGFSFALSAADTLTYYGFGPGDSYDDRHLGSYLSLFTLPIKDLYPASVFPQEGGNRCRVRYAELKKDGDPLLRIDAPETPIALSVLPYSTEALDSTAHGADLLPDRHTHIRIDYRVSGVGSASCGPALPEEYALTKDRFSYSFSLFV